MPRFCGHLEEEDDPQRISQEDVKVITGHEYVSRLHELKDEINRAWHAEDRVTTLKLTIQVIFSMGISVAGFICFFFN